MSAPPTGASIVFTSSLQNAASLLSPRRWRMRLISAPTLGAHPSENRWKGMTCPYPSLPAQIGMMIKNEINESIPPVYTRFMGQQLLGYLALDGREAAKARRGA